MCSVGKVKSVVMCSAAVMSGLLSKSFAYSLDKAFLLSARELLDILPVYILLEYNVVMM